MSEDSSTDSSGVSEEHCPAQLRIPWLGETAARGLQSFTLGARLTRIDNQAGLAMAAVHRLEFNGLQSGDNASATGRPFEVGLLVSDVYC